MVAGLPELTTISLTVYTDALLVRGRLRTRAGRVVDIFDPAGGPFLIVEDVTMDEHGSRGRPTMAPFAQVRLETILFAFTDEALAAEPDPAPQHPAVLLAVPPFVVAGTVDALPGHKELRDAVADLPTGFIRVAGASFWSDPLNEGRRRTPLIAVNGSRVQIAAPFRDVDPWAGLDLARAAGPAAAGDEDGAGLELGPAQEA
jgi:hypothetical protein